MKHAYVLMAASFGLLAACSGLNEIDFDKKDFLNGDLVEQVIFEAPIIRALGDDDETRASLSQDGDNSIRFGWEATDIVGIYPDQGSQVAFEMTDGVGTNIASFDGGGWALRKGYTYSCYYPLVSEMFLDRNTIPVSFANQVQTGVSTYDGVRFFLASEGTSSSEGALRFSFQMLNTVIRIKAIGLPAGNYTKLTLTTDEPLFVQEGTFGLEDLSITGMTYSKSLEITLKDFTLTQASTEANPALIYLTSAPVNLAGKKVTVRVHSDDGTIYGCEKTPSKAYEAGAWGGLKCEMEKIQTMKAHLRFVWGDMLVFAHSTDDCSVYINGVQQSITDWGWYGGGTPSSIWFDVDIDNLSQGRISSIVFTLTVDVGDYPTEFESVEINNNSVAITSQNCEISGGVYRYSLTLDDVPNGTIPANQIWYTTDNGNIFNKAYDCHFYDVDGNELSFTQTWDGTKWIMEFSDEVCYWEGAWFYVTNSDSRLVSLGVPASLDAGKMTEASFYQKSFAGDYVSTIERFYGQYEGIADDGHIFLTGKDLYLLNGVASAHGGILTIPEGITEIAGYAFVGSKAKTIILPSTIEVINDFAFENCQNVTDIFCYAEQCPQFDHDDSVWTYVYGTSGVLHYPVGSDYSQFPVPSGWTKVADINEWDGFRLTATSENTVLVLTCNGTLFPQELYYSFDAQNWNSWEYNQEIHLNLNQVLYLKGHQYFGDTSRIEALSGSAYGSGYVCSLFDNGTDYSSTTIPNQALQDIFLDDGKITGELRIPDVVKVVGTRDLFGYACYGTWWTSVILPKELEFIGGTAFESNQMTEITIPKTVKYIGDAAFCACYNLVNVYFTGTVAEWSAIEKGNYKWVEGEIPANKVICSDGEADF